MGVANEPHGVCIHRLRRFPNPLLRLLLAALQRVRDRGQVFRAARTACAGDQIGRLCHKTRPAGRHCRLQACQHLAGLADAPARDRDAPAAILASVALCPRRRGDPHEFLVALRDRRQVEAVGLYDAFIGPTAAVALALLIVADDEDSGLEQRPIERLDPRGRQSKKLLLQPRRRPRDRPRALLPVVRHRLPHKPRYELEGVRRQAEIRLRLLEGGEIGQRFGVPGAMPSN